MRAGLVALVVILVGATSIGIARAQFVGGGSIGGGGGSASSSDAETLDSLDSLAFVQFGLCSNVDDICVNVAGKDYTCSSATECRFGSTGAAQAVIESGSDSIGLSPASGTVRQTMFLGVNEWLISGGNSITGRLLTTVAGSFLGISGDAAATTLVGAFSDTIASDFGKTDLVQTYGEGLQLDVKAQTCNCGTAGTPNTVTCTIGSGTILLTDGDADACTVTLATTSLDTIDTNTTPEIYSRPIRIIVDSLGGGGAFNIADSAGVIELDGGTAWAGTTVGSSLTVMYAGGSIDAFLEESRSIK